MKNTTARIKFKSKFGNANQFLVTSIVALHHLNESDINEAPTELHTSWSPLNRSGTINRSRNFIKQSFLAWAVDSIDMYVSLLNRSPRYLQKQSERLIFEQAGRSVYKKSVNLGNELKINPVTIALLDILITWRNNSLHSLAENTVAEKYLKTIKKNKKYISDNYRGLDPSLLPEKAHSGSDLTFKEVASLINVAHKYVEEVDSIVISNLDKKYFAKEAIMKHLKENPEFLRKYSSLREIKRERMIKTWLQNNLSYPDAGKDVIEACCNIETKANK